MINRRGLLQSSAALSFAWPLHRVAAATNTAATNTEPRLVLLILRGGMDGLAAVPAHGDPDYRRARGNLADALAGAPGFNDLDGFFGLHSSFSSLHQLFERKELAIVHAVAPPYRERSHFDAQDVLEAGIADPSASTDGWLYRALALVPGGPSPEQIALSLGGSVPLVLRGARPVSAWAVDGLPDPDADTMARVLALYQEDALLGPELDAMLRTEQMAGDLPVNSGRPGSSEASAVAAARLLSHSEGPRIAVLDVGGWDTHANQLGQLSNRFSALDTLVATLRTGLGEVWSQTRVDYGHRVRTYGRHERDSWVRPWRRRCGLCCRWRGPGWSSVE